MDPLTLAAEVMLGVPCVSAVSFVVYWVTSDWRKERATRISESPEERFWRIQREDRILAIKDWDTEYVRKHGDAMGLRIAKGVGLLVPLAEDSVSIYLSGLGYNIQPLPSLLATGRRDMIRIGRKI